MRCTCHSGRSGSVSKLSERRLRPSRRSAQTRAKVQSHVADQAPAFGGPDHPADLERELPGRRVLDIGGTMLRASTSLERQHQDTGRRIGEQPIVQMIHRQSDGFLHRHRRRFLIAGIIDAIVDRRSASDTAAQQHPS
jgi:hypothetical protein